MAEQEHKSTGRSWPYFLVGIGAPFVLLALALAVSALKTSGFSRARRLVEANGQGQTAAELASQRDRLALELAYLQNRLQMSNSDSVCLSLDLQDSLLFLEIKGVQVRACSLQALEINGSVPNWKEWIRTPFVLQETQSTIRKKPIRVVIAPADTIEAMERRDDDIPVEKGLVYYTLVFDRGLTITIAEKNPEGVGNWTRKLYHESLRGLRLLWQQVGKRLLGKQESSLHIYLELPAADAKAVYRAIPVHAQLALRPPRTAR
ncbi:MAG: hypothetical protein ONB23_11090 [candidate division KSB1 bacterium]|nr:hypothetical protein [candidate division KSB1 bacterium]